jgi:hypothetical protein
MKKVNTQKVNMQNNLTKSSSYAGLNHGPFDYESNALPLSHMSILFIH